MEPTDATIIGVNFLNYIKSISTCFGHYYAHHQETRKRDWLKLHVKLCGCGGGTCMVGGCGQCAYNCSQHNQVASQEVLASLIFQSPDDGHKA
jgi:hypothetical protein